MRKKTMIAAAVAGGTVITALIAGPSIAAGVQATDIKTNHSAQHHGDVQQHPAKGPAYNGRVEGGHTGANPLGHGKSAGAGADIGSAPTGKTATGTMTDQQKAELAYMAEEELVAHDLYTAFAALYENPVFSRVAASESEHLEAVRNLMELYGVSDPTIDHVAGTFSNEKLQDLYNRLLAQGLTGEAGALESGRTVEKTDIEGLTAAVKNAADAPDAKTVFTRLLQASQHHLSAFDG